LSALIDVWQKSLLVTVGTTKRYIVYFSGFEILGSLHKRFKIHNYKIISISGQILAVTKILNKCK
jgi:hypothetical protein